MTIAFLEGPRPASEGEIADTERQLGVQIPAEYRTFLLTSGSGRPEANFYQGADQVGVTGFLGVEQSGTGLLSTRRVYRDRVPPDMLPVAEAEGGNLICLSLREDDHGAVHFWDHELEGEEGEPPGYQNMEPIALGFTEFMSGLVPSSDQPERAELEEGEEVWVDPEFLAQLQKKGP